MAGLVPAMTTEAPFTQEESYAQPPHPVSPALKKAARGQGVARRGRARVLRDRPRRVDAARLRGARPRGVSEERHRASRRAARQRGRRLAAADAPGAGEGARRASAARAVSITVAG